MRTTHGKLPGPTVFREDSVHHGMITGSVTVVSGISLHSYGMIAGDLDIEPGATVDHHGMIAGSVNNRGRLTLNGRVAGSLSDSEGETVLGPGSEVGDRLQANA
jgi:cytoskeletal protein CcmA (bactofilin family)